MASKFNKGIDLKFNRDLSSLSYDLEIIDGELVLENSFDTTLLVSLFTDRRAEPSQQPNNLLRRGWWGDLISSVEDYLIGSRLWILEQSRLTNTTLNYAIEFTKNALSWLVDQDIAQSIEVAGEFIENGIRLKITITRENNIIETRFFDVWLNTGT